MREIKLIINEVDCYSGNNARIDQYAKSRNVQHQIMLMVDNKEMCLGFRNRPADEDRGEEVVFEKLVSEEVFSLFQEAKNLKKSMRSEHCKTKEEYEEAAEYNKPIKEELSKIIEKIYNIESLDLPFKQFSYHINY